MSQADTRVFASDLDEQGPVQLDRDQLIRLAQCGLNETALNVLLFLLGRHNSRTGIVKATQQELAAEIGVGRQAVNGALKILGDKKLVTRVAQGRYQLAPVLFAPDSVVPLVPSAIEYRATQLGTPSATRPKLRMVTD
ncbi:replication/maintenance protein RepL [Actinomadura sp. NPDC048955]|uniref:replication/maintenance protein RepL n=1 Tax=Actinomadura sp. NPDC048955 TaxID=3158228 RepID=UPI0033D64E57